MGNDVVIRSSQKKYPQITQIAVKKRRPRKGTTGTNQKTLLYRAHRSPDPNRDRSEMSPANLFVPFVPFCGLFFDLWNLRNLRMIGLLFLPTAFCRLPTDLV